MSCKETLALNGGKKGFRQSQGFAQINILAAVQGSEHMVALAFVPAFP